MKSRFCFLIHQRPVERAEIDAAAEENYCGDRHDITSRRHQTKLLPAIVKAIPEPKMIAEIRIVDMGVASQFVTLAEYLRMEYPKGVKDELIKGEVVISPAAKPKNQLVTMQLLLLLNEAIDKTKFLVNYDTSIVVEPADPASMPRPDVFVMNRARFRAAAAADEYPEGSPELAIEVISPSNTKQEIEDKIELYLANGSLAVWIVYPRKRSVVLWQSGGKKSEFKEGGTVPLPQALGRRGIQVAEIFSVLP